MASPLVSVIIVSYNTRDLLRTCLAHIAPAAQGIAYEVIVVDNASSDGSAHMVAQEFPHVWLIKSAVNLGFARANNRGAQLARGALLALINPDAQLFPGTLREAARLMEDHPDVALCGGALVDQHGAPQPSARRFPGLLNEFLMLSGLAARFPRSRFFGRADRTWADPRHACYPDWVPGALAVVRRSAWDEVGGFDERFFLYFEEVDLCRRLRATGYRIAYWPALGAMHIGGASSKTVSNQTQSEHGSQLTLWQMRSALLYYRKHHGVVAAAGLAGLSWVWHTLRCWRHRANPARRAQLQRIVETQRQAWRDTAGGRVAPPVPW